MLNLYERIGGDKAVDASLDIFYKKVLDDPLLSVFFKNTDMEVLIQKQKSFLTFAFGGPSQYSYWQRGLRNAHKESVENGMNDQHFDFLTKHLEETLVELSIEKELIIEVLSVVEGTRDYVLNK